jgi:hypothetical protein
MRLEPKATGHNKFPSGNLLQEIGRGVDLMCVESENHCEFHLHFTLFYQPIKEKSILDHTPSEHKHCDACVTPTTLSLDLRVSSFGGNHIL